MNSQRARNDRTRCVVAADRPQRPPARRERSTARHIETGRTAAPLRETLCPRQKVRRISLRSSLAGRHREPQVSLEIGSAAALRCRFDEACRLRTWTRRIGRSTGERDDRGVIAGHCDGPVRTRRCRVEWLVLTESYARPNCRAKFLKEMSYSPQFAEATRVAVSFPAGTTRRHSATWVPKKRDGRVART